MPALVDMTGQTFGRLKVISRVENANTGHARWLCVCACGAYPRVSGADLRNGHTTSCGCAQRQAASIAGLARKPDSEIKYASAHARVKYDRGRAAGYPCVDCGQQAREWSLRKDAAMTFVGLVRGGIACRYSGNPGDYDPRCKACHAAYDRE